MVSAVYRVSRPAHRVMSQAPGGFSGNRRHEAEAVHDEVPHRPGPDGQYGERPGWPHHSVGVPGPAHSVPGTGRCRVMSQAPDGYSGDRRHEAEAVYDEVAHRPGPDGQ